MKRAAIAFVLAYAMNWLLFAIVLHGEVLR